YQRTLAKWHFWLSMIGTNITFFAMLALGYLGMPRRYATYQFDGALAPLATVTTFHQLASVGALILLVGQLIFVWNLVQSWLEGPQVGADPWNLKEEAPELFGREYIWHENRQETQIATDGGEGEDVAADGGLVDDENETSSERSSDGGEPVEGDDADERPDQTDD
ncbi:cbb3-type cytochrome c oxidase subunit I, partial [Halorientalis pallida]